MTSLLRPVLHTVQTQSLSTVLSPYFTNCERGDFRGQVLPSDINVRKSPTKENATQRQHWTSTGIGEAASLGYLKNVLELD